MTLSKPRVIVDMLYDVVYDVTQYTASRLRPEEQDDDWLVEAIQNAENMSAELADPREGVSKSFFYDLTYHAVNRRLSIDEFYCILKLYNIVLY